MFTAAERNALILTVTFLLLGAGAKAWVRAKTELGPFGPSPVLATLPNSGAVESAEAVDAVDIAETDPSHPSTFEEPVEPGHAAAGPSGVTEGRPTDSGTPGKPAEDKAGTRSGRKAGPAGLVDVNRDGVEALASVPGIGPKTAQAIIAFRETRGPIGDLRDLLEVKGIGERKLERMAPHLVPPRKDSAGG
jgi:competence ComEA-like helix-hairpin-helix protein